jgi:hydrogenase/urease accessory protein HupE
MIRWKSGEERAYTLTSRRPTVRLYGGAEDTRAAWDVAATYALLGVEHILSGFDHLLFVISLLFLVGFQRRLVATITAFTLAHSITLAASALGALSLRPPPVEATIALSIVLVAMEALQRDDTLTRRWPALVAFLFGLVHGLGFAGALAEIGLPARHATIALLTFNVGVEAGQLLVVAVCGVLLLAVRRLPRLEIGRQVALYAIGSVAAYWTIGRLAALA